MENRKLISEKVSSLNGSVKIPGDKSISHRALILASQALGITTISGLLESEDVLNTKECLEKLGVQIQKNDNAYIVTGNGLGSLTEPQDILDCGNSGTGCRLLMGLVSSYNFNTHFMGDDSLKKRPMDRVFQPLEEMTVSIEARQNKYLPAMIKGKKALLPIEYELPVPSAQVKSAILLAALNIAGDIFIIEPIRTRNHTELMMKYLGIDISETESEGKNIIRISGQKEFDAKDFLIPGDPSSAAFPVVAALITENSEVRVNNVMLNKTRTGLFDTLKEMGANLEITNERVEAGENIGDIIAKSSNLQGVEVSPLRTASMIDEYPILSIAASTAEGKTKMLGLKELRVKESDRFSAIKDNLLKCGINVEKDGDNLTIIGGKIQGGVEIESKGDHRIAMSFLIAGMISENSISITESETIATSFPNFVDLMNGLGAKIS